MIEYFRMLDKNIEFFEKAYEITLKIKNRAKKIFDDCEIYITGSYARGEHTLSSDLDILIVSESFPEKMSFEYYKGVAKELTDDYRINIHLCNKKKFEELRSLYEPLIPV